MEILDLARNENCIFNSRMLKSSLNSRVYWNSTDSYAGPTHTFLRISAGKLIFIGNFRGKLSNGKTFFRRKIPAGKWVSGTLFRRIKGSILGLYMGV